MSLATLLVLEALLSDYSDKMIDKSCFRAILGHAIKCMILLSTYVHALKSCWTSDIKIISYVKTSTLIRQVKATNRKQQEDIILIEIRWNGDKQCFFNWKSINLYKYKISFWSYSSFGNNEITIQVILITVCTNQRNNKHRYKPKSFYTFWRRKISWLSGYCIIASLPSICLGLFVILNAKCCRIYKQMSIYPMWIPMRTAEGGCTLVRRFILYWNVERCYEPTIVMNSM